MNDRYEPIVWDKSLATGVEVIDQQHQILVNMINEANYRLASDSGRDVLEEIVRDLISYAIYHFDTEEELIMKHVCSSEEREAHFQEHREFSQKVSGLLQELKQGRLVSREDLLTFLNNWLLNHILVTDRQLGKLPKADSE